MPSPSRKSELGAVKVKNTFIEYVAPDSEESLPSSHPVQRSKTYAVGDLWTDDDKDDAYFFPPRSSSDRAVVYREDVGQRPQKSPSISPAPRTPSPEIGNDHQKPPWVIAWIDERSFKDQAKGMKDHLNVFLSPGEVKCYKLTANFLKTFERKFLTGGYLDRHKMIIIVSPPNFGEIVSFFKTIPNSKDGQANKGLRALIVFKASGPPTHGPGSIAEPCPYTTIFAHEWTSVIDIVQQITLVHTS